MSPKETLILDSALALLIETGDAGLTLRKLAERSDMRLSNVQYYFNSRDDVIAAMVAMYFDECTSKLRKLTAVSKARSTRERVQFLVRSGLIHGQEISDMCRAFREIWAISTRNESIDQCLMDYYRGFAEVISDYAFTGEGDQKSRKMLQSLLVPYFEGYSITARALPIDIDEVTELLTGQVLALMPQETDLG